MQETFASNWIAPAGPQIDAFEREFAAAVGMPHAVAVDSGTAALHLAMRSIGVQRGDEVFVSTFTFVASANAAVYEGAQPVFIDSETSSWNMDPVLLEEALREGAARRRLPRAVVVVHAYGQSADMAAIQAVCDRFGVPVVEDAAESLGATCGGRAAGTCGAAGVFSFNGNKIITTAGGGMLVTRDKAWAERAHRLATQARESTPHHEHTEIGYNYRMSNVLAAIGRGQLRVLERRVAARRANFEFYRSALQDLPGVTFMPEAPWGRSTRWLTCLTIDPAVAGVDRERVRRALEAGAIEARPLWKPLHQQPVFAGCESFGGAVADRLFAEGLCLPSGSNLRPEDLQRVAELIRGAFSD